jgi:hypothetical protein
MSLSPVSYGFGGFVETFGVEGFSCLFADRESTLTQRAERPGDVIRVNPPDTS